VRGGTWVPPNFLFFKKLVRDLCRSQKICETSLRRPRRPNFGPPPCAQRLRDGHGLGSAHLSSRIYTSSAWGKALYNCRQHERTTADNMSGDIMRALVICGVLLFSGTATAQDRASCFRDCVGIFWCRHQCPVVGPESTTCKQTCVAQIKECKKQCNRQYPNPLLPPPKK
jgi:hypothetical protein